VEDLVGLPAVGSGGGGPGAIGGTGGVGRVPEGDRAEELQTVGDAEVDAELRDAKERIEDELGRACAYLAYPYGEEQPRIRAAAERAGYAAAFALPGERAAPDRFAVPRVGLYRGDGRWRVLAKCSPLVDRIRPQGLPAL
jgi:peptidoglycan/xylan/chitin deacetylase (PgdA/CDA1 family)